LGCYCRGGRGDDAPDDFVYALAALGPAVDEFGSVVGEEGVAAQAEHVFDRGESFCSDGGDGGGHDFAEPLGFCCGGDFALVGFDGVEVQEDVGEKC